MQCSAYFVYNQIYSICQDLAPASSREMSRPHANRSGTIMDQVSTPVDTHRPAKIVAEILQKRCSVFRFRSAVVQQQLKMRTCTLLEKADRNGGHDRNPPLTRLPTLNQCLAARCLSPTKYPSLNPERRSRGVASKACGMPCSRAFLLRRDDIFRIPGIRTMTDGFSPFSSNTPSYRISIRSRLL